LTDAPLGSISEDCASSQIHSNDATRPHASIFDPRPVPAHERVKIAVAKDAAFNFYYQENFELLEAYGADIIFFSPLAGESLPEGIHGLYIGGGFPEEFADSLSANHAVRTSIRDAIEKGLPTLAECGGFMYLTDAIEDTQGQSYPMLGLIPGIVRMQKKLAALGYRDIRGAEGNFLLGPSDQAKGHEFHYSTFHPREDAHIAPAYETKGMRGTKPEGYIGPDGTLVAGYTHIHFASAPAVVERWIRFCSERRRAATTFLFKGV
jgi:cobyrinic acid a,c-diamide synthase